VRVRREGREWVWRLRDGQPLGEDEMAEGDVAQISVSSCAGLACLERARSKSPVHWTSFRLFFRTELGYFRYLGLCEPTPSFQERTMQTAGASELAYANTALLMALMERLAQRNVLSWGDLLVVVDDAVEAMKPQQSIASIAAAIRYIEQDIVRQINESTPLNERTPR
jgi:hypothetical protein